MINLIVEVDKNYGIGFKNQLPRDITKDLDFLKVRLVKEANLNILSWEGIHGILFHKNIDH